MKTLRQALIDYEMALLQAIAACRKVPLTTASKRQAIELLAQALLLPAETAVVLSNLSPAEQEALQAILAHGGKIEGPRFARQYGTIRPMGAARLERERPWVNPANPAEGLWYRGLIFKTFQITDQGGVEFVFVPDDLLEQIINSNLHLATSKSANVQSFEVSQAPVPAVVISGEGRLRENIFNLLVYLHTTPVRLQDATNLAVKDRKILTGCLQPALLPTFTLDMELDFLLHLGQRAGLLVVSHGRLRPNREPSRAWLQNSAHEQTQFLQNTWRADPTWNDLWRVPGLAPQPTGWENSPLLARSKILNYLSQLTASAEAWFLLGDFVATIKRIDPDFQRPNGDYDSWYIQDVEGNLLMGFAYWDKVEGALIRHVLTHLLLVLGVVEMGLPTETSESDRFRITSQGKQFLLEQPVAASPAPKSCLVRVDDSFLAYVPDHANLYDRFQLARFAQLERHEQNRVVYHITQASVSRALRNGVTADQMVAFLARVTNNRTPLKVVETLRTWGTRQDSVKIERAHLLRLKHENLVEELRQNRNMHSLLGEVIGPTTILVPSDNIAEVRRILTELGYLE
ncbi:MAG: helicase-associated domain-containing protein [Anaerolineae bacterium]|nr:helicase-associated domain-containing protein [Anaerolineae bacterium]